MSKMDRAKKVGEGEEGRETKRRRREERQNKKSKLGFCLNTK